MTQKFVITFPDDFPDAEKPKLGQALFDLLKGVGFDSMHVGWGKTYVRVEATTL